MKVFIDGSSGTTGLRIRERLSDRKDINLNILPDEIRRNTEARREALNNSDIAILCLPDKEAIEAVNLIDADNKHTKIIDTSTAHRVLKNWVYGFPEVNNLREKILNSNRIANPGCHATGFISLVAPLVHEKILNRDVLLSCFSLTGYSGGGKKMIAQYESPERDLNLNSPGLYGLNQNHKHLPEMKKICDLENEPVFCPIVADYYSGMLVMIPVYDLNLKDLSDVYKNYYPENSGLVKFGGYVEDLKFIYSGSYSGRDDLEILLTGNESRAVLISRFDNLGKGASGAAVQNLNLLIGADEFEGLIF